MSANLLQAIDLLKNGDYTCVLCMQNNIFTSTERGIKPLLDWVDSDICFRGFSAADKVVGKAAAFLYILLGVKEIYAPVMSEAAIRLFLRHGIFIKYDRSAKMICNRMNSGPCPMEQAVQGIDHPDEACTAIRNKLQQLNQ